MAYYTRRRKRKDGTEGDWQCVHHRPHPAVKGKRLTSSKTFKTQKAAKAWGVEQESRYNRDPNSDPSRGKLPFATLAEQWLAIKKPTLAPRSYDRAEQIVGKHLLPVFGRTPVSAVTFEVWRDHLAKLAAEEKPDGSRLYAPGTLHRIHGVMTGVMEEARVRGIVTANPVRKATKKVVGPTERKMTFLTGAEIHTLANAINPHYRTLILTAGFTGLRASELHALRRRDIAFDLEREGDRIVVVGATITVGRAIKTWRDRQPVYGTTKSNRVRTVDVAAELAEELHAHLDSRPAAPDTLIFTSVKTGGPIQHGPFLKNHFKEAAADALPYHPGLRFHDLRHSFISLLLAAGVDVLEVAGQAGHKHASVTLDVYGHRMPSGRDRVKLALSAAYTEAETVVPLRAAGGAA